MKYPTNKPTQAQIKVAKEAFYDRKLDEAGVGLSERFAAAITAAAEVGYSEPQGTGFQAGEAEPAAAEVGEPRNTELEMGELAHRLFLETIERCAQVVHKALQIF